MTIPNAPLDDVSFNEIFENIRKKIPTYSKIWTDFNYSDPGITFLDLFSWLAENKIYSLNHIPKKNYLKFLKLVGIMPKKPIPLQLAVQFEHDQENKSETSIEKNSILTSDYIPDEIFTTDFPLELVEINVKKKIIQLSKNPEKYLISYGDDIMDFPWNFKRYNTIFG